MKPFLAVITLGLFAFGVGAWNDNGSQAQAQAQNTSSPVSAVAPTSRKFALLVGVKEYDKPYPATSNISRADSGWSPLNTDIDVRNLKRTLMSKWGFKDADILTIVDLKAYKAGQKMPYEATRKGIMSAFRDHFTKQARPGDVCVFMYSGHGQQVPDALPNGDGKVVSDEKDGLDESFVTFNYKGASGKENAATNLRDDDVSVLLDELGAKMKKDGRVEGNITFIADSCHSGTISRGNTSGNLRKGRQWEVSIDGPLPKGASLSKGEAKLISSEGSGLFKPGDALAEGYVAISACQNNQSAFETTNDQGQSLGGALVYNLCRALEQAPAGAPPTYRDLFERLAVDIQANESRQFPAIEGNVDIPIFGGQTKPMVAYPRVAALLDGKATVNVGQMHGVTAKSRYDLYAPHVDPSEDGAKALVTGAQVEAVDLYTCQMTLPPDTKLTEADLRGAKAVLTEQAVDSKPLRVLLAGTAALQSQLAGREDESNGAGVFEFKTAVETSPGKATKGANSGLAYDVRVAREVLGAEENRAQSEGGVASKPTVRYLTLRGSDGALINAVPDDAQASAKMRNLLLGLWRASYLQGLQNPGEANGAPDGLNVTMKIKRLTSRAITLGDKGGAESNSVFHEGEAFALEIENNSEETAYISILDIQPDGSISLLFPDWSRKAEPDNYRLGPHEKMNVRAAVGAPFGRDVFKLLATPERVDFSPLVFQAEKLPPEILARKLTLAAERAAKGNNGENHPLAKLMLNASKGHLPRAATLLPKPASWGTASVTIETRPAVSAE